MAILVVFNVQIEDETAFAAYQKAAFPTLAGRSFKKVAGPQPLRVLEGPILNEVIILRFDDLAAAEAWYDSPEYQAAIAIRAPASITSAYMIEAAD